MTSPTLENQPDLEAFFRLSQDNLCIAGYDGYFRKVNPAFVKLLGYSEEELFAVPISTFVHPEDKELTAETRSVILDDKPLLNFENRYITKAGGIRVSVGIEADEPVVSSCPDAFHFNLI